ncbi:unnamed protein product [Schistocephalus solidus]|uniref:Uncharacterized protein n=1 Tax=Schistocephalus solidus TaxID=70667 RepID=A0A183TNL1_SCHSO|nr:unnamed protein product [Schistocephalus solidus]
MLVMHQPPPSVEYNFARITVHSTQRKLRRTSFFLEANCLVTRESTTRSLNGSPKASQPFDQLQAPNRNHHDRQLNAQLKMYKAVVLMALLLRAETWTIYSNQTRKLNQFHRTCLRRILKLRWQDRVLDTEVLE